jgi:diacylglycerol kinase (ATP)
MGVELFPGPRFTLNLGPCTLLSSLPRHIADPNTATRLINGYDLLEGHGTMLPGVLSNPLSGGNRKGLKPIRALLACHPYVLHREVHTLEDVLSAMADFARREVNLVVINGGDGTVHGVLTALFRNHVFGRQPFIAVLRAGTTSMIGGDVGLAGSPRRALRRLLHWVEKREGRSEILWRHVMSVRSPAHEKPLCGTFLGAASIYEGIRFFHRRINAPGVRGEFGPAVTLMVFLLSLLRRQSKLLSAVPVEASLDGQPPDEKAWLMLFVTTLERLFLGMRPFWGNGGGALHFTAITEHPIGFWRSLPFLVRGRKGPHVKTYNGFYSQEISQGRLSMAGGFTMDGELYQLGTARTDLYVGVAGQAAFLRV